jgi:hypothetical protein
MKCNVIGFKGSAILQVAGCRLQVTNIKWPVAMNTLKLIVVYYS